MILEVGMESLQQNQVIHVQSDFLLVSIINIVFNIEIMIIIIINVKLTHFSSFSLFFQMSYLNYVKTK